MRRLLAILTALLLLVPNIALGAKAFDVDTGGTLTTGLQAWYNLEDVNDEYTSAINLTNNNGATFASGKISNAVDLEDGSTQYLDTTNTMGVNGGNISWAGWIKVESAPANNTVNAVFVQGNNTSDTGYWASYFNDNGTLKLFVARGKYGVGDQTFTYTTTLTLDTWYHLVYTYNGTTVEAFLNGSSIGTVSASGSGTADGFGGFAIGRDSDAPTGRTWDGMIDLVGVWNKALSATEISDLYNSGNGNAYREQGGGAAASTMKVVWWLDDTL